MESGVFPPRPPSLSLQTFSSLCLFFCRFFEDSQPENTAEEIITQKEPVKLINFPFTSGTFMQHFQVFFLFFFGRNLLRISLYFKDVLGQNERLAKCQPKQRFSHNDKNKLTHNLNIWRALQTELRLRKFPFYEQQKPSLKSTLCDVTKAELRSDELHLLRYIYLSAFWEKLYFYE